MQGLNNLCICLVISFVGLTFCSRPPQCKSQSEELWQHTDPNKYWYCKNAESNPIVLPCPENTGFLRNRDRSGCVPYTNWVCTTKLPPPLCKTDEDYYRLHRHINPNKFWGCPEPKGTPPVAINCPHGYGFVDTFEKNVGCVPFEDWYCKDLNNPIRE